MRDESLDLSAITLYDPDTHWQHIKLLERKGQFARALENCHLGLHAHSQEICGMELLGILCAFGEVHWARSALSDLSASGFITRVYGPILDQLARGINIVRVPFCGEELSFRLTGENWELESVHLSGQLYEAIEVEHLVKLVPANGAFLDVGANIGNHSIAVAKLRPDVTVIPIEAEPRAVRILEENIELNRVGNVDTSHLGKAHPAGNGETLLQWASSISSTHVSPDQFGIRVPNLKLQDLIEDKMLVKLDIEGLESAILQDSGEVLDLHAPLIMAEMLGESEHHMLCSLESLGYEIKETIQMAAGNNIIAVKKV